MGMTMSFYQIQNKGLDRDAVRRGLAKLGSGKDRDGLPPLSSVLGQMLREEFAQLDLPIPAEEPQCALPSPMVAYRADAAWLPFWDLKSCEGCNASSRDCIRMSEAFGVPVLAFSVFDSDILLLSYGDAASGVRRDYAKPNFEEMDEFDTEQYLCAFPDFLRALCPADRQTELESVWNGEEVFAEDRVWKLCALIGADCLFDELPEGYEAMTAQ